MLAIVALEVPLAVSLGQRVDAEVRLQATNQADVVAASALESLVPLRRATLQGIVKSAGASVRGRVLIVDRGGVVLADSSIPGEVGVNYRTAARPEIAAALGGRSAQDTRRSDTLGADILVTATPIGPRSRPVGAVRITQGVKAVHRAVRRTVIGLGLIGLLVLALGLLAGALIARQVTRPLRRLEDAVERIAGGDLTVNVPLEGSSEQQGLARAFNRMTERLARALRTQQDFVADASHQLRTPLTGLRLRLEEARAAGVSADAATELAAGEHEIDRLAETVDELLVLSKAGERDLPGEAADIDRAAARAAERWGVTAADAGHRLEVDSGANGLAVWCAPSDLDRALDALVENAIRYAAPDTTITIVARPGRIEVLDHGPGLAADEEETVFERFHRGRAGRQGPSGTGLGLPIARELARRWGGDATIANRDGGGARATLAFPDFTGASPDGG